MLSASAFVQTVLEQPDADAPRLVFADWLEERGDPLAELIRVQCDLARSKPHDPRTYSLKSREQELLIEHDSIWMKPIREMGFTGRFSRGLLDVSIGGAQTFLDCAERLFAMPWVLYVDLRDAAVDSEHLARVADSPAFSRLKRLDLSRSDVGNPGMLALSRTPHGCSLGQLILKQIRVTSDGLRSIVGSMNLSRLTELRLYGNYIGAEGARALAGCPQLRQLRILDLSYNRVGTVGGEYLAESHFLNHLRTLYVRGNNIGPGGKKALLQRFGPRVHFDTSEPLP